MSGLSTHVLDLTAGRPAADVAVRLRRTDGDGEAEPIETFTNADGRARLLDPQAVTAGRYRLEFDIGAHFRSTGASAAEPGFLETVVIEFHIPQPGGSLHVPLLVSPFGYSTYRGS